MGFYKPRSTRRSSRESGRIGVKTPPPLPATQSTSRRRTVPPRIPGGPPSLPRIEPPPLPGEKRKSTWRKAKEILLKITGISWIRKISSRKLEQKLIQAEETVNAELLAAAEREKRKTPIAFNIKNLDLSRTFNEFDYARQVIMQLNLGKEDHLSLAMKMRDTFLRSQDEALNDLGIELIVRIAKEEDKRTEMERIEIMETMPEIYTKAKVKMTKIRFPLADVGHYSNSLKIIVENELKYKLMTQSHLAERVAARSTALKLIGDLSEKRTSIRGILQEVLKETGLFAYQNERLDDFKERIRAELIVFNSFISRRRAA